MAVVVGIRALEDRKQSPRGARLFALMAQTLFCPLFSPLCHRVSFKLVTKYNPCKDVIHSINGAFPLQLDLRQ